MPASTLGSAFIITCICIYRLMAAVLSATARLHASRLEYDNVSQETDAIVGDPDVRNRGTPLHGAAEGGHVQSAVLQLHWRWCDIPQSGYSIVPSHDLQGMRDEKTEHTFSRRISAQKKGQRTLVARVHLDVGKATLPPERPLKMLNKQHGPSSRTFNGRRLCGRSKWRDWDHRTGHISPLMRCQNCGEGQYTASFSCN